MRTRAIASGLLAALVLSACAAKTDGPGGPTSAPGSIGGPGATADATDDMGAQGTWTGTLTRELSKRVTETFPNSTSVSAEDYKAVVRITSTAVDIEGWELSGSAELVKHLTSDLQTHNVSPVGPCSYHYTEDASADGTVTIAGGLETRNGIFQFHVNIPGLDPAGTILNVWDETGCNGANKQETNPWYIGSTTSDGDGDLIDPNHISGGTTTPTEGGEDKLTWSFTFNP
jgi:hypothetical protein